MNRASKSSLVVATSFVGLALLYLLVESFVMEIPNHFPFFQIPGEQWGWSNKTVGIIFSAALLVWWPWLRQNVGLRWRQSPGSLRWSLGIFFSVLVCGIVGGLVQRPQPFSLDTLFFQATMPSIEEEWAYRGIALALLERAFGQSPMSCRWRFGWASLIASLLFWHGLTIEHGRLITPLSHAELGGVCGRAGTAPHKIRQPALADALPFGMECFHCSRHHDSRMSKFP